MSESDTIAGWNAKAEDWHIQVGHEGDLNRRLNSDPVLWSLLGDVGGLTVLDAGCGTGYLSRKLAGKGADVVAVDAAEQMIAIARRETSADLNISYRVDSCATLATIEDGGIDRIVSNYVLMDILDLDGTIGAFHRVLKLGGAAVIVFTHPCFPFSQSEDDEPPGRMTFRWEEPYFDNRTNDEPPWAHFTTGFVWHHRPLRHYWRVFRNAGFSVDEFDEPGPRTPYPEGIDPDQLRQIQMCPVSVAFRLLK